MFRRTLFFTLVGIALFLTSRTAAQPATTEPGLFLKSGLIIPNAQERPALPLGAKANEPAPYIVQFHGPIQAEWRADLIARGITIQSYLPQYAYRVRMTPIQAQAVSALATVRWVGQYRAEYKMAPSLAASNDTTARLMMVGLNNPAQSAQIKTLLAEAGGTVIQASDQRLLVLMTPAQRTLVAQDSAVDWIEAHQFAQTYGSGALDQEGGVVLKANAARQRGYNGSTQTIAVADTGLSTGVKGTVHADLPASRITNIFDWQAADMVGCYDSIPNGAQDVSSGHGTHVALSAVGGGGPNGEGQGVASAARLIFQAIEDYVDFQGMCQSQYDDGYYLLGLPSTDLYSLWYQAVNSSSTTTIHSNSWGSDAKGDYDAQAQQADEYMWLLPSRTLIFAAGNSGVDSNANGIVDSDSISSPATAKNVISVGASENDRGGQYGCDSALTYAGCNGQNATYLGYGDFWLSSFPAAPLRDDPTTGNAEQMAAFSSRGPTDDGRIKPDVVAPGTWVLSGYSARHRQGYDGAPNPQDGEWQDDGGGMPFNQSYKYMFGTSMATPLAAGSAAIVRDFYTKRYNLSRGQISAALVKATLINTADDLLDENNDGANDNDFPVPNIHEGWGRINLDVATSDAYTFTTRPGLTTGNAATAVYNVTVAALPCRISLVWTDYPADPAATTSLVNDLDLLVTAPDGTVYRGNVLAGGWSSPGGTADRVNPVENVYIQAAAAGPWTVRVQAFNVPQFQQPYALVVRCALLSPTAVTVANYQATQTAAGVVLRWRTMNEATLQGFHIYRSSDGVRDNAVRITTEQIPAQGVEAAYEWLDTTAVVEQTYTYWLQSVATDSSVDEHGPVVITTRRISRIYLPQVVR